MSLKLRHLYLKLSVSYIEVFGFATLVTTFNFAVTKNDERNFRKADKCHIRNKLYANKILE